MAGVDPELAHLGAADQRDVGRRGRAQAAPELRVAAFFGRAGVGHAGEHLLNALDQHLRAGARQRCVQREVEAAEFDGAGHTQLVAQARDGDLELVVEQADLGRGFRLEQFERGAVALAGVDRHAHTHLLQQRGGVGAGGHHEGVGLELARLAGGTIAHAHRVHLTAAGLDAQDVVAHQGLHALVAAQLGELLGEGQAVAGLVALGVGAADDAVGKTAQRGFDLQQLVFAHHLAVHAVAAHQFGGAARLVKRLLAGVVVGDALGQAVVLQAGAGHHVFQRGVAVAAQRHQLRHVAFKGGVVALAQELHAPEPLRRVQLRAEFERAFGVEQPLQRLQGRLAVGPGLAIAHRNLRCVAKAGFQRGIGLAIHQRDFVAPLQQMPRGAHTNDACTQYDDLHDPLQKKWDNWARVWEKPRRK